ncbi:MAG: CDP-alcohol phosphatidyltransferase family protein [Candidatus Aenigmarchaeota archaeon]|nr:CDP-alcohol phosphatidyltransferase family protein [Candidatus Aenigmarchaeota archaeon]
MKYNFRSKIKKLRGARVRDYDRFSMWYFISIANIITLAEIGVSFGSVALIFDNRLWEAVVLMLIAAFLDWNDGRISRKRGTSGDFGKNLDSLADLFSFGVVPAFLSWKLIGTNPLGLVLPALLIMGGALRLARYNITATQGYIGMPITFNGLIFPAVFAVYSFFSLPEYVFAIACGISLALMVANFRVKKLV